MKEIDEKILNYCGIYNHPEISEKRRKEIMKMKRELEERTGMKIEKIYVYGKSYWGKEIKKEDFAKEVCFLVDERIKRLDETRRIVNEYVLEKEDTTMAVWSLCQFEKRRKCITERDYYMANCGALIYDSGKEPEVDERIYSTEYAARMSSFKYMKEFVHLKEHVDLYMKDMLEIYLLKIGYYAEEQELTIDGLIKYLDYVSENKEVKNILNEYKLEKEMNKKIEVYKKFEKYVENTKKNNFLFKLSNIPTMRVYEKKKEQFEKQGILDFKKLTKDELYIMYVIEIKYSDEIAKLYGVEPRKITQKNDNWKIRVREAITNAENMREMNQKADGNINMMYLAQKMSGLLSFEDCIKPILAFMKTSETYLLKEFWRFTEFEKNNIEKDLTGTEENTWYRATLAMDFLKDNELVEEVDFKKYRITTEGRKLKRYVENYRKDKIDLPLIVKRIGKANLFGIIYTKDDILQIEELQSGIYKGLLENLAINQEKAYTKDIDGEEKVNIEKENNEELSKKAYISSEEEIDLGSKEEIKEEIDIEEQIENLQKIEYKAKEKNKKNTNNNKTKAKRDYIKEAKLKTESGKRYEEIIYEKEKRNLIKEGRTDLAEQMEWTSQTPGGDSKGYDIISFRKIGNEYEKVYIEVKGTTKDYDEPFEISITEIEASEKYKDSYYLCRIAKANTKYPIYYEERGSIRDKYKLEEIKFRATKKEE